MGQRTRMGRAKTRGVPISRGEYRGYAERKVQFVEQQQKEMADAGQTHPGLLDNAAGRARFAAKHAAEPWVKYERTEQSNYSGPKTAKPRRFSPGSGQSVLAPSDVMLAVLALGARLRSYRR